MTRRFLAGLFVLAACITGPAMAQAPTQGHPLVPPYPGSEMDQAAVVAAFDEFDLPTGPMKDGKPSAVAHLEGKVTMFAYRCPSGRSLLEIFRNYESAFKTSRFTTLFTCKGGQCGSQVGLKGLGYLPNGDDARYLAVKLARPEGDVFVGLHLSTSEMKFVVVEVKPMEAGLVKIPAGDLRTDLLQIGHVAVYELLFDTARAELKPESTTALRAIAALLTSESSLKLYVVGHTDNAGPLAQNLDLSRRRAQTVVTALSTTYKVEGARLHAEGAGPLAPVASNDSEEGRAKNRRVELVKQ